MDSVLLHFWGSAAHQGRCSLSWLPWCSALVEFALWWVRVCAESSAVIRPQFLAAGLLLFFPCSGCALFWVPCHPSGRTSSLEAPALLQEFLVLESLALAQPFPEDLLKPRLLERSARSSLTVAAALHQQCLGHSGSGDPVDMAGATGQSWLRVSSATISDRPQPGLSLC